MKHMARSLIALAGILMAQATLAAPVTVIATIKITQGEEESFKAAAATMVNITRTEGGNLSYKLVQSATDSTEFATVELWRSQADIDQHMKAAHMQTFFQIVSPLFIHGYPVLKSYENRVK